MKNTTIQAELETILKCLSDLNQAASIGTLEHHLEHHLKQNLHKKTIQRRLKKLVDRGDVIAEGDKKLRTYRLATFNVRSRADVNYVAEPNVINRDVKHPIFSDESLQKLTYLDTPSYGRAKKTYQLMLLEEYIPNETTYVPLTMREQLHKAGKRFDASIVAGTYAKQIGQRLLIDLSYNSSRLEGNTYSKLDTQKLIEQGLSAEGKVHEETVMIMNHKEAIEFLVENAEEISLSPFTIKNLHYLLSQDLIANPNACGKEREIEVAIGKSAYTPLNNPHQIKEYLVLLLLKAEHIYDPFEQSFFLLMHLSYLQAFEDVNKRTARLACNIPFIQQNFCPLSFIDVPQEDYFKALLYFYETNELLPALDLFLWTYKRSCEQYDVAKESLGEIDAYRIQYRAARKAAMGQIIRSNLSEEKVNEFLRKYCVDNHIESPDKFIAMTNADLTQLHEGAIIGLGITESMFKKWKNTKKKKH